MSSVTKATTAAERSYVDQLLQQCRSQIGSGLGMDALASVLSAIRISKGEDAIMGILGNAKRTYEFERQSSTASLDLASILCEQLLQQDTILSEQGMEDILVDAFQDGSSVVCQRCNGLVPRVRMKEHSAHWCSAIAHEDNDDDEEEYLS